jgi:hypothetical protein
MKLYKYRRCLHDGDGGAVYTEYPRANEQSIGATHGAIASGSRCQCRVDRSEATAGASDGARLRNRQTVISRWVPVPIQYCTHGSHVAAAADGAANATLSGNGAGNAGPGSWLLARLLRVVTMRGRRNQGARHVGQFNTARKCQKATCSSDCCQNTCGY